METTIRQASVADRDALWSFIKEAFGVRAQYMIPDRWNWQYLENPFVDRSSQQLPIWVAVKAGKIVGQTCGWPVELKVGDEIHRAIWGGDLMVSPTCRGEGIARRVTQGLVEHYGLYLAIMQTSVTRHINESLGCINIDPIQIHQRLGRLSRDFVRHYLTELWKQRPIVRRLAQIGCTVLLMDRVVPLVVNGILRFRESLEARSRKPRRTRIREVERFGDEIDRLWDETNHQYHVIGKRDQRFLNWRFAANKQLQYRMFTASRDGRTTGYIVLRRCQPVELNFGIIVDLYASRDDEETLEDLVDHAIRFFATDVVAIVCAATPAEYQRVLTRLGFRTSTPRTPNFICTDPALRARLEELKGSWFLTKADQDWDQIFPQQMPA